MSEPFLAEVKIWAGNFAPRHYAFCNGQLLPIAQNTALFAIIGTTYGGDGRTTMGLPNLQGRAPMHPGQGPGLSTRRLGEKGGTPTQAVTEGQMPGHQHTFQVTQEGGDRADPANQYVGAESLVFAEQSSPLVAMDSKALPAAGGNQFHENMQPYLALSFIIALVGLFPSRS